jgi:hypothetical protein
VEEEGKSRVWTVPAAKVACSGTAVTFPQCLPFQAQFPALAGESGESHHPALWTRPALLSGQVVKIDNAVCKLPGKLLCRKLHYHLAKQTVEKETLVQQVFPATFTLANFFSKCE